VSLWERTHFRNPSWIGFSAKIHLSYPSSVQEKQIFQKSSSDPIAAIGSLEGSRELLETVGALVESVHLADRVVEYAKRVIDATRTHSGLRLGVSTRGGVSWMRMARAHALVHGRDYVTPDDLFALAIPCLAHRLVSRNGSEVLPLLQEILNSTPVENVP
jgi:MoxR-like ATPase